jgi:hypothetical protein
VAVTSNAELAEAWLQATTWEKHSRMDIPRTTPACACQHWRDEITFCSVGWPLFVRDILDRLSSPRTSSWWHYNKVIR